MAKKLNGLYSLNNLIIVKITFIPSEYVLSLLSDPSGLSLYSTMTFSTCMLLLTACIVIVEYRDRPEGSESKLNTYSDGMKVIFTIIRLFREYKPFSFFAILALILMAIAFGFFVPVFIEYWETGLVAKFPTLIVCGFVGLAAVQSFFAGMILQNIARRDRKDFELDLIRLSGNDDVVNAVAERLGDRQE